MSEWIKCSERLPKEHEWILIASYRYQAVTTGIYMDGKFVNPDLNYLEHADVSHWRELPEPPAQED